MIRHIVFTKFADPEKDGAEACRLLRALPERIPEIVSLEANCDQKRSERSWDTALTVTFRSWEDLAVYDTHPAHQEVRAFIKAHRTGTATVDYEL